MNQVAALDNFPQRSLRTSTTSFSAVGGKLSFILAMMVTVNLGTFLASEIYKGEGRLMVRSGRENVSLGPAARAGQVISFGQTR